MCYVHNQDMPVSPHYCCSDINYPSPHSNRSDLEAKNDS
jgi:hypothetical protein